VAKTYVGGVARKKTRHHLEKQVENGPKKENEPRHQVGEHNRRKLFGEEKKKTPVANPNTPGGRGGRKMERKFPPHPLGKIRRQGGEREAMKNGEKYPAASQKKGQARVAKGGLLLEKLRKKRPLGHQDRGHTLQKRGENRWCKMRM